MRVIPVLLVFLLTPHFVGAMMGREASEIYQGDSQIQEASRRQVRSWTQAPISRKFNTGSELFDGEWFFGTYVMAGLGEAQMAMEQNRSDHRVSEMVDRLLADDVRQFQSKRSGHDPLDALDNDAVGDAAYLGYMGMVMGLERILVPDNRHAELHDKISKALSRRLSLGFIETYPGEIYPVDNLAVLATLALHQRSTKHDHAKVISSFTRLLRAKAIDPQTGLLIQNLSVSDLKPGPPRGSGTTLGTYFASFADASLSSELYKATQKHLTRSGFGFRIVREYPEGVEGSGDIDSGPVVLSASLSATGFSLGAARSQSDQTHFKETLATANFWGVPTHSVEGREYVFGGPLGNAILFAMTTAQPATRWSES